MDAHRAQNCRSDLLPGAHLGHDLQLESLQLGDGLELALEDDKVALLVADEVPGR